MFTMAQKPWTPAAELSVQGMRDASQSYAAMDKEIKVKKPKSNIFGDILPIVGMAAGAMLGGPLGMTAAQGAILGSAAGGMAGPSADKTRRSLAAWEWRVPRCTTSCRTQRSRIQTRAGTGGRREPVPSCLP